MSLDGIISRFPDESVTNWTSKEDHDHLLTLVSQYDAVLTGRKSFISLYCDKPHYILTNDKNKLESNKERCIKYISFSSAGFFL
ncbi:MAG: hypothetical protein LBE20_02410 [Deltaproteobacteria bacterium]|nr:hypothetical protein [Deltaproteobacteria bacterium]